MIPDNKTKTIETISQKIASSDVLILSGGISVGRYDYVKESLEANEVEESTAAEANEIATDVNLQVDSEKKPIIDENWCNVSVKNIINFRDVYHFP